MPQAARQQAAGAESTRAAILTAAERLFAEKGFDRARLEDVAEAVGIRRASIVYYFKDKREVYDAVLEEVFGAFRRRLEESLSRPGTLTERVEDAVATWVDYVGQRPTFARILLREVADAGNLERPAVARHIGPFVKVVERFMQKHAHETGVAPVDIDPAHMASTIAGATVFFVAAMPALMPSIGFDPMSAEHLAAHRAEVMKIIRRLMGTTGADGTEREGRA